MLGDMHITTWQQAAGSSKPTAGSNQSHATLALTKHPLYNNTTPSSSSKQQQAVASSSSKQAVASSGKQYQQQQL